jgi:hypothetical protein
VGPDGKGEPTPSYDPDAMHILIPVVTFILGIVLGAVVETWYGVFVNRPKLKITGGGTGLGQHGYRTAGWTVTNEIGFVGIRFGPSTILGKQLHRAVERGVNFDRAAAKNCRAAIYDSETNAHLASLFWTAPGAGETGPWREVATIPSGESYSLMLFARPDGERATYFIFRPTNEQDGTPVIPQGGQLGGTRRFRIEIRYSFGRRALVAEGRMRADPQSGGLYWEQIDHGKVAGGSSF